MAFAYKPESIICPNCNFEGQPALKRSEFGYWAVFVVLLAVSFFWLFWPLLLVALVILSWLLVKRANKVCPRCRFEIPAPKRSQQ